MDEITLKLFIFTSCFFDFRVSGNVCCDGFALNHSTGLCQSKCDKIYGLKLIYIST